MLNARVGTISRTIGIGDYVGQLQSGIMAPPKATVVKLLMVRVVSDEKR
jgi:hypothetical protein